MRPCDRKNKRGALMFNGKEDFNLEAPERLCRNGDV